MGKRHHTGIALIAGFKLLKAALLLVLGLGLRKLVDADIYSLFTQLLENLHLDADSHLLHFLALKIEGLQPENVLLVSVASLAYAGLFLAEGLGLWFERTWAAYLTVVSTSVFIPFEVYQIVKQVTAPKIVVLLLNLVIVLYLIAQLKHRTLHSASRSVLPG